MVINPQTWLYFQELVTLCLSSNHACYVLFHSINSRWWSQKLHKRAHGDPSGTGCHSPRHALHSLRLHRQYSSGNPQNLHTLWFFPLCQSINVSHSIIGKKKRKKEKINVSHSSSQFFWARWFFYFLFFSFHFLTIWKTQFALWLTMVMVFLLCYYYLSVSRVKYPFLSN